MLPVNRESESGIPAWATHGAATIVNAHPQIGGDDFLALVHNGVIENFDELRQQLIGKGYRFVSETDTEVVAHLITDIVRELQSRQSNGHVLPRHAGMDAIKEAVKQLRGTYGLVVIFKQWPDAIFAARLGSPLVIGVGTNEHFHRQ